MATITDRKSQGKPKAKTPPKKKGVVKEIPALAQKSSKAKSTRVEGSPGEVAKVEASKAKVSKGKVSPVKVANVEASKAQAPKAQVSKGKVSPVKVAKVEASKAKVSKGKVSPVKVANVEASKAQVSPAKASPAKASPAKASKGKASKGKTSQDKVSPVKAPVPVQESPELAVPAALAVNLKLVDIAQSNVAAGLEFARDLAGARTPMEAVRVGMAYWYQNLNVAQSQALELRKLSAAMVTSANKPIRKQIRGI